jgi:hypothetical protein
VSPTTTSATDAARRRAVSHQLDDQLLRRPKRGCGAVRVWGGRHDGDADRFRRAAAERDAETRRKQERKHERPEDRFRLADELAHPDEHELDERGPALGVSHRATPGR